MGTCCDVKLTSAPMVSPEGVPVHLHMLKSTEESIFVCLLETIQCLLFYAPFTIILRG